MNTILYGVRRGVYKKDISTESWGKIEMTEEWIQMAIPTIEQAAITVDIAWI